MTERFRIIKWAPGFILFLVFFGCGDPPPTTEEIVLQAESLIDSGQFDAAIRILERQLEAKPDRVDFLEPLAFAYSASGEPVLAAITFTRIAQLASSRPEYYLYASESLKSAGDLTGAVGRLRDYLNVSGEDRPVWVNLAQIEEERGNTAKALEALLVAERLSSRPEDQISLGRNFLFSGNLAQAQVWYARALEVNGDHRDDALLGLLETAVRSRRFSDATKVLQRLDDEYPGAVDGSSLRTVRVQLADWQEKREEAKKALAALEVRQRLREIPIEEESEEVEPETPSEEEALVSDIVSEEIDMVADSQQDSLEETPDALIDTVAEEDISQSSADEEVPDELPGEVAVNPAEFLASARDSEVSGNYAEAIINYRKYLVEDDRDPAVWAALSLIYLKQGEGRWAQATASEAMRRAPQDPTYVLVYLRAIKSFQRAERSIAEAERAARRFPNEPDIILELGRIYDSAPGNERNSRIVYERFLEIADSAHPDRLEIERRLAGL